jgi:hypothetical protein
MCFCPGPSATTLSGLKKHFKKLQFVKIPGPDGYTKELVLPDTHARPMPPLGTPSHVTPPSRHPPSRFPFRLHQPHTAALYISAYLPFPSSPPQLFFAIRLRSSVVSVLFSVTTKTRRTRLYSLLNFLTTTGFLVPGLCSGWKAGLCRRYLHCFWPTRWGFSLIVLPWGGTSKKRVGDGEDRRDIFSVMMYIHVFMDCFYFANFQCSFLLLPSLRIVPPRKLQTPTLKPLRLSLFPRTPRHIPTALTHLDLDRRHEALSAKIRPMPIRKRAREAEPTRLFGRVRFEVELVEVVRYGEIEGAGWPVDFDAHEGREDVEIGHGERRDEVEVKCWRAVAEHVGCLA